MLSLEVATPENKSIIPRCHQQARKVASQAAIGRMQLILHATRRTPPGASHLVLAMPARSVKTQPVPSIHCRDARVCGHTTTAMHDNEYTPILRRHDFAGVTRRPGAFTARPGHFLQIYLGSFAPPGAIQRENEGKRTYLSHAHSSSFG